MNEAEVDRLAYEYAHNPEEVQTAMWLFILDTMGAYNEELISFKHANDAVFKATLLTGAAIERATGITKTTH